MKGSYDTLCRSGDQNQIHIGVNEITIHGGRKNQSIDYWNAPSELGEFYWEISEAYVMSPSHDIRFDREDIGVALISKETALELRFFDRASLRLDVQSVRRSKVIPICLASTDTDLIGRTLKGAGWGIEYNEYRHQPVRKPDYSSCMTSEKSIQGARFKNCDMTQIRLNNWECRTDRPPSGYDIKKCEKYINKALKEARKKVLNLKMDMEGLMKLVTRDIVYVEGENGDTTECIFSNWGDWKDGWCELPKLPTKHEPSWGICSPSCNKTLMKVV